MPKITLNDLLNIKPEEYTVFIYKNIITDIVRTIRKPKLNAENKPIYCAVFPFTCEVYSRKVIRLASDEIRVPTPPIFTPRSSSL